MITISQKLQTYMFYQLRFFSPDASDALISTQAGIIVGSKTAAQVCSGMLWGRLADSEWGGRKTVLLIGLISSGMLFVKIIQQSPRTDGFIGLSCIGYGFSTTFASAVAWQVFGGAMSSNVGIVRCVVAELNPEKRSVNISTPFTYLQRISPSKISNTSTFTLASLCKCWNASWSPRWRSSQFREWSWFDEKLSICSSKYTGSSHLQHRGIWSSRRFERDLRALQTRRREHLSTSLAEVEEIE